jgi:hypothetical protein
VKIEKNMGYGAFREVFAPVLARVAKEAGHACGTDEDYVTGQKEQRIIATLEPVINAGRLIVNQAAVEVDIADCSRYDAKSRQMYSFFYQLAKMTRQRNALLHDDRADALEGLVRHYQAAIAQDQAKALQKQREAAHAKLLENPLGYNRTKPPARPSLLSRFRGRR